MQIEEFSGWTPAQHKVLADPFGSLACRVRTSINVHEAFDLALQSMKEFFARLAADPPGGLPPKQPAQLTDKGPAPQPKKTPPKEGNYERINCLLNRFPGIYWLSLP